MPDTPPAAAQPPAEVTLYDGKYLRVVRQGTWEFVRRPNVSGIVGIVAVTDDRRLVLVEQYRRPVGRRVIELPAGLAGDVKGSEAEDLADAARRELLEETGYAAAEMTRVCAGPPTAGLGDEVVTLFRATGLRKAGPGDGDGDEDIMLHEPPLDGIERWLAGQEAAGKLVDIKVWAGLYFAGR